MDEEEEEDGMNNRQVVHSGLKRWKKKILLDIFKNFINLITKFFFSSNQYLISSALFAVELTLTIWKSMKNRCEKKLV